MEQVWFAGVHKDIGGGYCDDSGLSDLTLRWMVANTAPWPWNTYRPRNLRPFSHPIAQDA